MSERKFYYLTLLLLSILVILPIWLVNYPPLVDYPNHLARAFIISNYNKVQSYQKMYEIVREPIPNIAIDILLPLFLKVIPNIKIASKLFLTLTVLFFILGCHLLAQSIHRFTWLGLCGPFLVYNSGFLYGFVNYVFGLGLFF